MLDDAFSVIWSWPGSIVVRDAIALADPCAESPFESWSRAWILRSGLPRPEVNVPVFGGSGRTYYGDFVWRRHRLIGEADGVGKYGDTAAAIRQALRAERARQADLEAGGWRVVRWVTGDPGRSVVARWAARSTSRQLRRPESWVSRPDTDEPGRSSSQG